MFALLLTFLLTAAAETPPAAWPVAFSEVYLVEPSRPEVIPLTAEGIRARRFHLRLRAARPFEATVTRDRDGSILYDGRRRRRHEALLPWGAGESAHLTLRNQLSEDLHVTLEIALDPAAAGQAVHSFQVNRFLRLYEAGETASARQALVDALAEDPHDSTATLLLRRVWREQGLTEPPREVRSAQEEQALWRGLAEAQRLRGLRRRAEAALAAAGWDSARAVLAAADSFVTVDGIAGRELLRADLALEADRLDVAVPSYQRALHAAEGDLRRRAFHGLFRANRILGNEAQAEAARRAALAEAEDADQREAIRAWR